MSGNPASSTSTRAIAAATISAWDVVLALVVAAMLALGAVRNFGLSAALPAYLYLASAGAVLTIVDRASRRLPNSIIVPSYFIAGVLLSVAALVADRPGALVVAVVGGATLWGLYFAIWCARPAGLGFGEVKLAGLLGAYLAFAGVPELVLGAFAGFLTAALYAIGLLAVGRATRSSHLAFGPWMLLGTGIGLAVGAPLDDLQSSLLLT